MSNLKQIWSFLIFMLLQVLVFNEISFLKYLNPYVYIIFILLLPMSYSGVTVLLLAFLMGTFIDISENTGGIHVAASVFLAWIRKPLLSIATQKRGVDFDSLRIDRLPLRNFAVYALLGVFLHHLVLFLVESSKPSQIGMIMVRTSVSGIFTFIFVILVQLWNFRKKD